MALSSPLVGLLATPAWPNPSDPTTSCEQVIASAEPASSLPPGLLTAIARIESGRSDPLTRRVAAWPWAINAAGSSIFATSREEAVARVRELLARGVRSVDVGCMQINLQSHPAAFSSLEEAFEPRANVAYAIRFLAELRARLGEWPAAIAAYHSSAPGRGAEYARRIAAAGENPAALLPDDAVRPGGEVASAPALPARRAISVVPAAARVQVITPSAFGPVRPMSVLILMPRRG